MIEKNMMRSVYPNPGITYSEGNNDSRGQVKKV